MAVGAIFRATEGLSRRHDAITATVIHMPVARVLRTKDSRWRLEIMTDGRRVLIHLGAVVLRDASWDEIGQRLTDDGVDPEELYED